MGEEVMRQALETVVAGRSLDVATARAVMDTMMDGEATPAQVGALVAALRTKGTSTAGTSATKATSISMPAVARSNARSAPSTTSASPRPSMRRWAPTWPPWA